MLYFSYEEGGNGYEGASAQFASEQLEPYARGVLEVLRNLGADPVWCRYDGGYDEGFANFSAAKVGGELLGIEALKQRSASGRLGEIPDAYIMGLPGVVSQPSYRDRAAVKQSLLPPIPNS